MYDVEETKRSWRSFSFSLDWPWGEWWFPFFVCLSIGIGSSFFDFAITRSRNQIEINIGFLWIHLDIEINWKRGDQINETNERKQKNKYKAAPLPGDRFVQLVDAMTFGIIYHPDIRPHIGEAVRRGIAKDIYLFAQDILKLRLKRDVLIIPGGWRDARKEKPPKRVRVLVNGAALPDPPYIGYWGEILGGELGWWIPEFEWVDDRFITHWAPLPERPERRERTNEHSRCPDKIG